MFLLHDSELQEESFRPSFKFSGDSKSHKICKRNIIKVMENIKYLVKDNVKLSNIYEILENS